MKSWIYVFCVLYGCVCLTTVSGQMWGWLLPFPYRCTERPGEGHDDGADIASIPDPVPRGVFKPVKPMGEPTYVAFDLETSDLIQAYCRLQPNPSLPASQIRGVIVFTQRFTCEAAYALQVKVNIAGMMSTGNWSYHGLHIHQSGDMSNGCESMGPHFNPYQRSHGAQTDFIWRRHVGDLGNVVKDPFGNVQAAIFDEVASLVPGDRSILGRGVVLHENQDDLGRGNNQESLTTGNAGRRLACCTIRPL